MEFWGQSKLKQLRKITATLGLPGAVSLLSLVSAWSAIYFLLSDNPKLTVVFATAAFMLDILDGQLARRLNRASAFGRTLDSLVDLVNYSVLAGLATQHYLLPGALGFGISALIVALGVVRLALFTVTGYEEHEDRLYYTGVVTPHLSLAVLLIFLVNHFWVIPQWLVALILGVLALGQVSTIRTRKTCVLGFWIPVSIALMIGALLWL